MAVLVVILVYWVFSLLGPFGYGINFHFGDSCLHISMVLLVQSVERWPAVWHGKLLMTCWAIFALIIDLAYSGNLMASLTFPARLPAIDHFRDVIRNPDIRFVAVPYTSLHGFLQTAKDPTIMALYQKILDQGFNESHSKSDSYKDWADLVLASERQIAYFTEMDSYKLRAQLLWTTTSGQTDLHYSKETMLPAWYSYAMRKRAPYKEVLNKWIRRFNQFGLHKKWLDMGALEFKRFQLEQRRNGVKIEPVEVRFSDRLEVAPISLTNLQGPFCLHLMVLVVAAIAACIERIYPTHHY